ncbi:Rubisco accumulation factor 1.1 [Cardamine amara subsp. amara]|uniref:Rubisco accumulation factor 1.1 n=1 Tax=Cardamine amara subsp. amara TaxID=228776 RepID=A0ABD1C738_CARAN
MLSLTATTLKSSIFTKSKTNGFSNTRPVNPKPFSINAALIPASSRQAPAKQQLYQPFRPPPSPIPPKFRSLDAAGKIEVLADRMGLWFEYAPLISSLYTEGFTPPTIEELTGLSGVEQNCLIVGAQVRDSIVQSGAKPELIAAFDTGGAELLYEIRRLSTTQRVAAAEYIVDNGFDTKGAQDLARAIKDYPHRRGDVGWKDFDYNLPGDCLSFMLYRKSREHRSPSELRTTLLEQALEVAVTEKAKKAVTRELHGESYEERVKEEVIKIIRVPVVRLKFGEVAGASSVVVLPVCKAEEGEKMILEAPMEFESGGEFGVVEAEKEWSRWVVLPGWNPVIAVRKGGVAVSFEDDRKVLPWNGKEEAIMVVIDREKKIVEAEDGYYYLVVVAEGGMKLERGSVLKEKGVEMSLGMVVLVVRPPRDDDDEWQINDEDWD